MAADHMSMADARAYARLLSLGLREPEYAGAYRRHTDQGTRAVVGIFSGDNTETQRLVDAMAVRAYLYEEAIQRSHNNRERQTDDYLR